MRRIMQICGESRELIDEVGKADIHTKRKWLCASVINSYPVAAEFVLRRNAQIRYQS